MNRLYCALLVGALMLSACADPEKSAQKSLDAAKADWDKAGESLDPLQRVKAYKSALDSLDGAARKYKKTQVGAALAASRAVGGVSPAAMKSDYDRLAERAACYGAPTPECLLPFASSGFRNDAAGSAEDAGQEAMGLVCEKNFAKAEAALEPLKINRPVYAANLVQVALQAAQCDKPGEVKAAIAAYMAAEPAQGADRVGQLLGILQTDQLSPAWPDVLAALEKTIPEAGLAPGDAAGVDLTLAVKYASLGEADAALAKYRHVTEELGYAADVATEIDLASKLIAGGNADAGMAIAKEGSRPPGIARAVLHGAAAELGRRHGLIRAGGAPSANVPYTGDLTEFFAPVEAARRKSDGAAAGAVEAELDKFVATLQPNGEGLGMSGVDAAYGILALVQQKLGEPDKATALARKAEETRAALSRPGAYDPNGQNYVAEFQLLVALAQGDTDGAAALFNRVIPVGNDPVKVILVALARKGEAEKALTFAAATNRADGQTYELLINELGAHGHGKEAEAVLAAFPGDAGIRSALAWSLVGKAAAAGDMKTAESAAEKYSLLNIPAYRLRMSALKAEAAVAKKDRGKAEAAIREMFALGDALDKEAAQSQARGYYAQNAAAQAFKAGYADLGIELYRAASIKDQRPLFEAFSERSKPGDFPKVLMTAHDNLQGEALGYVIDSAIRRLEEKK